MIIYKEVIHKEISFPNCEGNDFSFVNDFISCLL